MTERRPDASDLLDVQADLRISIDGVDAHLVGEGQHLRLETDRPVALLRQLVNVRSAVPGGRATLARVVDGVADRGLTVLVAAGQRGPVLRIGAEVTSPLARRVVGTPHLQLVGIGARAPVVAVVGAAVALWWVSRRRR